MRPLSASSHCGYAHRKTPTRNIPQCFFPLMSKPSLECIVLTSLIPPPPTTTYNTHSLTHKHTCTLSLSLTRFLSHSHTHSLFHFFSHMRIHSLARCTLCLSLSLSVTLSLTLTHIHTHTHTHTQTHSLSLSSQFRNGICALWLLTVLMCCLIRTFHFRCSNWLRATLCPPPTRRCLQSFNASTAKRATL